MTLQIFGEGNTLTVGILKKEKHPGYLTTGHSFKEYIKQVYDMIDILPQTQGLFTDGPDGKLITAPNSDVILKKEDCVFWRANWLKSGQERPSSEKWDSGQFYSETRFMHDGIFLEYCEPQRRFAQFLNGKDGFSHHPENLEGGYDARVRESFEKINLDEMMDSPQCIAKMQANPAVKGYIEEFKRTQKYSFIDYAHLDVLNSQDNKVFGVKYNGISYEGKPTIIYHWEIQGFDGSNSSNNLKVAMDARTGKILKTKYEKGIFRSFGS